MEFNSTGRREVITERKTALPLFSAKGIRWDALMVTLLLILLLFLIQVALQFILTLNCSC